MGSCLKIVFCLAACVPFLKGNPLEPSLCGDWLNYKNEKCLKMLDTDGPKTQEDAENACRSLPRSKSFARLVTIKSSEQQEFVHQFLYENEISESVWLGLKVNNNSRKFEWNDGSDLVFNNSMKSNASDPHNQCVEMKEGGLWVMVSCTKQNIAVCEVEPSWPMATLHNRTSPTNPINWERKINQSEIDCEEKILKSEQKTDLLKEATDKTMDLLIEAKEQLAELEQRDETISPAISRYRQRKAVPIGFIYVELPNQPSPTTLWPTTTWTDVSTNYSGLFFRVAGGQAAPFGQVQDGNSPRLAEVEGINTYNSHKSGLPSDGSWSEQVYTGTRDSANYRSLKFRLSVSEVRPRNQAVRIWKRIQ